MYLQYGSYQHAIGEVSVSILTDALRNQGGEKWANRTRWSIEGQVFANDQPTITTNLQALASGYLPEGMSVALYFDNNQPSYHQVNPSQTLSGVRVIAGPSFRDGTNAEYSTFRSYQLVLEWETPLISTSTLLESFRETLEFNGGFEAWGYLVCINGPPQAQIWNEQVPQTIIQSGEAVGKYAYPFPASPIFPSIEHRNRRRIRRSNPRRVGPYGSPVWIDWPVSWTYVMESPVPGDGVPNLWIN